MTDHIASKILPEKAKPGIRYLATALDYFFVLAAYNTTYALSHQNDMIKFIWAGLWFIYFPLAEGVAGQTVGKFIFRLKVLKNDHSPISILNSIIRRICDIIDFLPVFGILGLLIASGNNTTKRIGDLAAGTIVVKI